MDSLTLLIPIALLFTAIAIVALFWAIRSGQFEDLDRAARDILFDDDPPAAPTDQLSQTSQCTPSPNTDKSGND